MWIVRLALRRPYTFVVAAILVFVLGVLAIFRMPTDIFPNIDIPVIAVSFNFNGMSANDMNDRIITPFERILSTTVNDIEHVESQSLNGVGVVKIYFQQHANIENANAQVTAISQTAIRQMPAGTQPPLIIEYNASNVPIIQLSVGSETVPEQKLFDDAFQVIRPPLVTLDGVQIPYPYGGKQRQIMVDLDPDKLFAYGISPAQVSTAINNQSIVLPAGTAKFGTNEYQIRLNSSPENIKGLNELPIRTVNGTTIYIKDVAHVRDGFQVQRNIVHTDGRSGVLLSVLKSGSASTLDVVDSVKAALPEIRTKIAEDMQITPLFDQSIFVRASVEGVVKEASIAAGLTALMILLFLGSWRSTLIVIVSIPLSILVAIICLWALGETLNVMTLGGMALAVGILVDDATVEIENIHRNLHQRKRLVQAILDGASQIAVPAFVSTICICIVFVPVVFISGAAKYLFTPLSMSVVFAMMTSYLLSRTLVPTLVHYLLAAEVEMYGGVIDKDDPHAQHELHRKEKLAHHEALSPDDEDFTDKVGRFVRSTSGKAFLLVLAGLIASTIFVFGFSPLADKVPMIHGPFAAVGHWIEGHLSLLMILALGAAATLVLVWIIVVWGHDFFNRQFEKVRLFYGGMLAWSLAHTRAVVIAFSILVIVSCSLFFVIGRDFFPTVDAGQIRLHVRAPAGTRIEQTQTYFAQVEDTIRSVIPKEEIVTLLDNMGIPNSSINLSLSDGSQMSPADGEILVSLAEGHRPTGEYLHDLRQILPEKQLDLTFFFAPADIVTQVLNFGLQAPVDIQIAGPRRDIEKDEEIAMAIKNDLASVPGIVDLRLRQVPHTPDIHVNVDRTLASQLGVSQRDVASDLLISLSSSNQTAPNFWLNPQNGLNYSIFVQTPQYRLDTLNELTNTPIVPTGLPATPENTQLLSNLATTDRGSSATNVTHYQLENSYDVLLGIQGIDLNRAANAIQKVVDKYTPQLPRGSKIVLRGQVQSMHDSFRGLGIGLIFAILLVYLLLVINFQSWLDPLIILMALPGAISGIMWMLWTTHTNLSVPALMGAIMSIGVATANSILMITFANDQRKDHGMNAHDAALAAGLTRLRPVIMTALAMIIGMLPMSIGLGEGGEQNAPLGRAVIGGLSMATFATLFFVPVMYSLLRQKAPETHVEKELQE